MDIRVEKEGGSIVIRVNGNIDEAGAEELKQAFTSLDMKGIEAVNVDMGGVEAMGSSAIGKLLLFYKNLALNQARLTVNNLAPSLYDLFCELKLDTLFTITRR